MKSDRIFEIGDWGKDEEAASSLGSAGVPPAVSRILREISFISGRAMRPAAPIL
jgi:hypothetical protein